MNGNYEKTLRKLEQAEAKLQKTLEKKKALEAERKALMERSETERLSSRGMILESFLKEPLILMNEDITDLLSMCFSSSLTQRKPNEKIHFRKGDAEAIVPEVPDDPE